MDVKDLAPSLLAFAEIIEELNAVLNKKDLILHTKIKSDFQNKCFKVSWILKSSLSNKMKSFLFNDTTAIDELLKIAGFINDPVVTYSAGGVVVITSLITYWLLSSNPNVKNTIYNEQNKELILEEEKRTVKYKVSIGLGRFLSLTKETSKEQKLKPLYKKYLKPVGSVNYALEEKQGTITEQDKEKLLPYLSKDNTQIELLQSVELQFYKVAIPTEDNKETDYSGWIKEKDDKVKKITFSPNELKDDFDFLGSNPLERTFTVDVNIHYNNTGSIAKYEIIGFIA